MKNGFNPTELRIVQKLSDGQKHSRKELLGCIDNDQADRRNLNVHMTNVRKKIPENQLILCRLWQNQIWYQHVQKL